MLPVTFSSERRQSRGRQKVRVVTREGRSAKKFSPVLTLLFKLLRPQTHLRSPTNNSAQKNGGWPFLQAAPGANMRTTTGEIVPRFNKDWDVGYGWQIIVKLPRRHMPPTQHKESTCRFYSVFARKRLVRVWSRCIVENSCISNFWHVKGKYGIT